MSKPIKQMMMDDYAARFGDLDGVVLVDIRGIEANDNNAIRSELAEAGIRISVVRNTLVKGSFDDDHSLGAINDLMTGPSAFVYGGDSVVNAARAVVKAVKQYPLHTSSAHCYVSLNSCYQSPLASPSPSHLRCQCCGYWHQHWHQHWYWR